MYGMPALLAQGLLFVGFIYCMAYFIQFIERLCKRKNKTIESTIQKEVIVSNTPDTITKKRTATRSYKFIIRIKSDVAQIENDSQYVLFDIKSLHIGDKELIIREEVEPIPTLNGFGNTHECIETFWRIEIGDIDLDESELKLICISKDSVYNGFSIYSGSQIIYKDKRLSMHKIEDVKLISGYQFAYAFENWITSSGLNDRPSIIDTANKRVL